MQETEIFLVPACPQCYRCIAHRNSKITECTWLEVHNSKDSAGVQALAQPQAPLYKGVPAAVSGWSLRADSAFAVLVMSAMDTRFFPRLFLC